MRAWAVGVVARGSTVAAILVLRRRAVRVPQALHLPLQAIEALKEVPEMSVQAELVLEQVIDFGSRFAGNAPLRLVGVADLVEFTLQLGYLCGDVRHGV